MTSSANGGASPRLLTPDNCVLLLIDHQPQMAFATHSIDGQTLVNNVTGLAKSAKVFGVPTILTTVAAQSFSGPIFPPVQAVFPNLKPIDRTTMNAWEDKNVTAAVKKAGRRKIVMAALWTEVCLATAVLSALDDDFEVYIVTDASGGVTVEAHETAIQRMIQDKLALMLLEGKFREGDTVQVGCKAGELTFRREGGPLPEGARP